VCNATHSKELTLKLFLNVCNDNTFAVVDRYRTITDMAHEPVLLTLLLTSLAFSAVDGRRGLL